MATMMVTIAWLYVVVMMAVAEAVSPQGTVLGAVFTFLGYGVLPLSIVLYILNTPARKRAIRRREEGSSPAQHDGGGEAPAETAVAPKRKEP